VRHKVCRPTNVSGRKWLERQPWSRCRSYSETAATENTESIQIETEDELPQSPVEEETLSHADRVSAPAPTRAAKRIGRRLLARLLNRMRTDKPGQPTNKHEAAKASQLPRPSRWNRLPRQRGRVAQIIATIPSAELGADLSAMRELANQSARAAIHTHQRKGIALRVVEQSRWALASPSWAVAGSGWSNLEDTTPLYGGLGAIAFGVAWMAWAAFKSSRSHVRPASKRRHEAPRNDAAGN